MEARGLQKQADVWIGLKQSKATTTTGQRCKNEHCCFQFLFLPARLTLVSCLIDSRFFSHFSSWSLVLEVGRAMALEGRPRPDAGACERVTSHGRKDFANVIPGSPGGAVILLSPESPSPQRNVRVDEGGQHQRGDVSSEAQVGVM